MGNRLLILCLRHLLASIAFTFIFGVAFLTYGLVFSFIHLVEIQEKHVKQEHVIDYTHCLPDDGNYFSCQEFFFTEQNDHCSCLVQNEVIDLHGEVNVHSQFELSNQLVVKMGKYNDTKFADLISNTAGKCDPYKTELTSNETCVTIEDYVFKDNFTMFQEIPNGLPVRIDEFEKAARWGPSLNNSVNCFQNGITVMMQKKIHTNMNLTGKYSFAINYYKNVNIWRRAIVLSTNNIVETTTNRMRYIEFAALGLGSVFLVISFALCALRKSVTGNDVTTANSTDIYSSNPVDPVDSEISTEEMPLNTHLNNPPLKDESSVESKQNNNTPDDTMRDANPV